MRRPLVIASLVALALACGRDGSGGLGPVNADPAAAEIFTSDIANFWRAYDAGGNDGAAVPFQRDYLAPGSPGLDEFAALREVTATSLAQMVRSYPRYFADVRETMLGLTTGGLDARLRQDYARMKAIYPEAVFPRVTFLVGRFSTVGTTGETGLLIGAEFFARDADTPVDELGDFQRANVHGADSLPHVVAHELVHIQQFRAGSRLHEGTLLGQSLREGSADFVGELVSGGNVNGWIHAWALPREAEVWADFRDEMNGRDVSRWLYNQGDATPDRPGDLGYFVGYRIAKAYYDRQADKVAAVRAIVGVRDAAAFLEASGYDPR